MKKKRKHNYTLKITEIVYSFSPNFDVHESIFGLGVYVCICLMSEQTVYPGILIYKG